MYGPCIVPTGPCLATCSLVRLPPLQSTRHRQGTSHLEFGTCVDWAVATHLLLPSVVCPNRITRNTLESVYATTSIPGASSNEPRHRLRSFRRPSLAARSARMNSVHITQVFQTGVSSRMLSLLFSVCLVDLRVSCHHCNSRCYVSYRG